MRVRRFAIFVLTSVVALACWGCETGFMQDAARSSLASFLTGVISTAVNETVGPKTD